MNIYPEFATNRADVAPGPWSVESGRAARGGAWCSVLDRRLHVPLGDDPIARVIRAHELMHARVSPLPHIGLQILDAGDVDLRMVEVAEEMRVNTLIGRAGFDVEQLCDGTEKPGGALLARHKDWHELIAFAVATASTGAEKPFLVGVRAGDPDLVRPLRAVLKRARAILDECTTAEAADTRLNADGVPYGYARTTVNIAKMLTRAAGAMPPRNAETSRTFARSLQAGGRRPASGRSAALVWADPHLAEVAVHTRSVRAVQAASSGTTIRFPERMLTDPHRRVFAGRSRQRGGVVILDQSGSMDLSSEQVAAVVKAYPDVLMVGYSHRPGDTGTTPNAWILAARGRVASNVPQGNVGNGVDVEILKWALSARQPGEPIVWITDGQVTDSNDYPCGALTRECAVLVRNHRVRLVRRIEDVGPALRTSAGSIDVVNEASRAGRVGRELSALASGPRFAPTEGVSALAGARWTPGDSSRVLGGVIGIGF